MNKLSFGLDSTLASYRKICVAFFGPESKATKYIDYQIAQSPVGEEAEVLVDERQMAYLLTKIHTDGSFDL